MYRINPSQIGFTKLRIIPIVLEFLELKGVQVRGGEVTYGRLPRSSPISFHV
jgi:hypothetical protein